MEPCVWSVVLTSARSPARTVDGASDPSIWTFSPAGASSQHISCFRGRYSKGPDVETAGSEDLAQSPPGSREGTWAPPSGWEQMQRMCGCLWLAIVISTHNGKTEKGIKYKEENEQLFPCLEHCLTQWNNSCHCFYYFKLPCLCFFSSHICIFSKIEVLLSIESCSAFLRCNMFLAFLRIIKYSWVYYCSWFEVNDTDMWPHFPAEKEPQEKLWALMGDSQGLTAQVPAVKSWAGSDLCLRSVSSSVGWGQW